MRRRTIPLVNSLAAVVFAVLIHASSAAAQSPDSVADRQRAVETRLLPAVVIAGEPVSGYTMHERMEHHGVPGASIAVIDNGHIDWTEGYGVTRAGGGDSILVSTLFQAASISKPVAATAVLRLVEEGLLDLDSDINDRLRSWRLPENQYTAGRAVTLRDLLSHTSGLTVRGFPGYVSGEPVPTAVNVLNGAGNTDAVRVGTIPGAVFRYSGGGYTVVQVLAQDVTGEPFANVVERLVLNPLGLDRSTYVQPLPERLTHDAALGHRADGNPVEGRWHTYPEQAAAGLWTTPMDLARFALGIAAASHGDSGAILQRETAHEMLSEHMEAWGLGVSVAGTGDGLRFSHGGANAGYQAYFVLYPVTGNGVAVMTNSDSGYELLMEVVRSVARVYDWPDYRPESRIVVHVDASTLSAYVGEYELNSDYVLTITREGEQLFAKGTGEPRVLLLAESETQFFPEGSENRLAFVRDPDDRVTHLVLHLAGEIIEAKRREP